MPSAVLEPGTVATSAQVRDTNKALRGQIARRIIGQDEVVSLLVTGFFAGGHCLLVGVPGLAKTMLIRSFAGALGLDFNRIQFTPDLMPSDVTGTDVISHAGSARSPDTAAAQKSMRHQVTSYAPSASVSGRHTAKTAAEERRDADRGFEFLEGPIFSNIILADEINRTPPKTQSALLEAMEEGQVTVAGHGYRLPEPFFVMATQNPIEQEGTYPLPLAALDRFIFHINVDYPALGEEMDMLFATTSRDELSVEPVAGRDEVLAMLRAVRSMPISDDTLKYATTLVRSTRPQQTNLPRIKKMVEVGGSPRAVQALILGGKAHAALAGRDFVTPRDVRAVALPALRHRVIPSFHAAAENISADELIRHVISEVPRPAGDSADPTPRRERPSFLRRLLGTPKPRKR
jgi:MoxR-like ATPase